ncbi:MAG TPA: thiamine pyrophosphate-dependent enzyme [Steroidobacteraceae bacterium]|nr:thiamine pyrophosphate-dependent enzyme [Steroidobacteraceae bacterium]
MTPGPIASDRPTARIRTGGEALVEALLAQGVDTVFALPGVQIYGLFDALAQAANRIRTFGARHEQACGYMAFGYGRSTGRPGVFAVVPGPGILNASAALLTAHGSNTGVLALTGDVMTHFKGRERRQLHEFRDQLEVLRALTKWAGHVQEPGEAAGMVARAFQEMLSGRPGATALQAPWDFFTRQGPVSAAAAAIPLPVSPIDTDAVDRAAKAISRARAPMIFVGSGALDASREVRSLAQLTGAPVVAFRGGRGVMSDDHPLGLTIASGQRLWPQTDLALVIGSRFELLDMRWRYRPDALTVVRIDIDPAEVPRLPADVSIVGDAAVATAALERAIVRHGAPRRRDAEIAAAKSAAAAAIRAIQPQVDYLQVIREVLPRDGFYVDEISQMGFAAMFGFPVYEPRTFVSCGHQGTLGFGFPTALGVKVAHPDRAVVSVTGDGGFMFAVQELATAVQYAIHLVTVVFNNRSFGNVYRDQQHQFGGRLLGSELQNPDFVRLAESFAVPARRVRSPAGLRGALEWAFAQASPVLIEVEVPRGAEADPWPIIHPSLGS